MRAATAIALRELRRHGVSAGSWVMLALFVLVGGYLFFDLVAGFEALVDRVETRARIVQDASLLERLNVNDVVVAGLLRQLASLLLFLVPLLTMRSVAGERERGTDELLLTAPLHPSTIVAGKFVGLTLLTWIFLGAVTAPMLLLVGRADPEPGPIASGVGMLFLAAAAMVALGLAVSSAARSQLLAALVSFVLLLVLYVADWPAAALGGRARDLLEALSLPRRLDPALRGLLRLQDLAYFVSLAAAGLFAARLAVRSERWR